MPTPPIDAETRASGGPVEDPDHDDFERVKYAQRIAETLIKRRSQKSIVVGLYGKWGEGKSSVLHFIKRSLAEASDKVVVLSFNPWRFSDETQLLLNFFGELAKTVGQNLLSKPQRAIKAFSSHVVPLIPSVSYNDVSVDIGKSVGELLKLAQPEIDKQRERIESLIAESGKRVVVIIDDIDRLEKTQIQAIFRLVKLTADFNHTSYLLAFDDEMVARAIGEIFSPSSDDVTGSRTLLAGQNFLEKIVQVPLRLPLARPDDLLLFCWNRLQEVFVETDITLESDEQERLVGSLRSAILPRLTTPRLAVRFANAVQFGLPLLRGEVNTVDQILVEAMHVFFPQLHQFVASHESDFAGGSSNMFIQSGEQARKDRIEKALSSYEGDSHKAGLSLLHSLFPVVAHLFHEGSPVSGRAYGTVQSLTGRKAVASPSYFARYFAYSVVRGDVSDVEFDAFLNMTGTPASLFTTAEGLIARLGINLFMQKVEYQVQGLTSEQAISMWGVLTSLSHSFDGTVQGPSIALLISQERVAAKLLIALLFRLHSSDERRRLIESLAESGGTFYFAKELQYRLRSQRQLELKPAGYTEGDGSIVQNPVLFSMEEWQHLMEDALPRLLLERALAEAGTVALYKSHPFYAFDLLFTIWPRINRQPDVAAYVRDFLHQSPEDIHDLMAVCSCSITMEGKNFLANVTAQKVAAVTHLFGSYLYDEVREALGGEAVTSYPGDEQDYEQPTPENRLRQFVYLYEHLPETGSAAEPVEGAQ